MNFILRFQMDSDWHVGAGFGRPGNVDRLLIRDADDLPYLPAKTVRGMWRDAAERLARGLDNGAPAGPWQELVDDIFGSQPPLAGSRDGDPSGYHNDPANPPVGTAVRVTPARLPDGLRFALKGKAPERLALRAAVSFVKPGVAIDPDSGRAKDDFLRFEEMGRAGTTLTAKVVFDPERFGGKESLRFGAARALVLAATKLITRIGGKRRRGAGKCRVIVEGENVASAIEFLHKNASCPKGTSGQVPGTDVLFGPAVGATEWVSVPLTVTLRGPVAVPARTVGNVVETLDFVPGTFFLAHVTRVLQQFGLDARAAIARGDIRVLNATIDVNGRAGLPMPMHLFAPKGKDFDHAVNRFMTESAGGQDKQLREGYIGPGPDGRTAKVKKVPRTVRTHNVVEDRRQRPTQEVGGVYSFEAIAPTDPEDDRVIVLRTELRLRTGLVPAAPNWWTKLDGPVWLGVSKKDDYGGAELKSREPVPVASNPTVRANELFVWLLSDVLLRGDGLGAEATVGALGRELGNRLNVGLGVAERNGLPLQFVRTRRTESWQTGWGLPRPSLVGLQAGSCVQFTVAGTITAAQLAEIEATGLGERTAEGFGQLAFNHPLLAEAATSGAWKPEAAETSERMTSEMDRSGAAAEVGEQTAEHIERAAWRESVRTAALAATETPDQRSALFNWQSTKPNMSQLGGLRSAVQFLRAESDRASVLGWLDAVARNPKREGKWPTGGLGKIKELLSEPRRVWVILREGTTTPGLKYIPWPTLRPARESALERELWAFAVRAFLDAAIRAHKRDSEGGGN